MIDSNASTDERTEMPTTTTTQPGTDRPTTLGSRRVLTATGAAAVGLSAVGLLAGCAAGAAETVAPPAASETASSTAAATPSATGGAATGTMFVDGTYSADGDYQSPNGAESVTVTVTVEHDVVTAVEVVGHATGGNSKQFQTQFASGIAAEVVGKPLDEVEVSRVAGSSLTSGGFNAAIDAIQVEAAA